MPILAELPLLPPQWRDALRLFVATLDAIAAAGGVPAEGQKPDLPRPDFKAGKDL